MREFATIAAVLHTAERQFRIGPYRLVHADEACIDLLARKTLAALDISYENTTAQTEH